MRFYQVFKTAYDEMMVKARAEGKPIFVVLTCEKADQLGALGNIQFKNRVKIDLPERNERTSIIEYILGGASTEVDSQEVSKYLQGKTYKEIK